MGYLNESVAAKMAGLHKADASACKGIAARFANMGISGAAASSAISNLIDQDAVPDKCICAATPSMFTGASVKATAEQAYNMVPSAS